MKVLTFFILFISLTSCVQKTPIASQTFNLTVIASKCKNQDGHAFLKEFVLLKDNQKYKKVTYAHESKVIIKDLTKGMYSISYKSIFNKREKVEFELKDGEDLKIKLCLDQIDYNQNTNLLLVDELEENEILEIRQYSQGCFHNNQEDIKFTKKEGKYIVEYYDQKKVLNKKQTRLLREFEIELRSNLGSGCTTTDRYQLFIDKPGNYDEMYFKNDGSCSWNGYQYLLEILGLKKKL